MITGLGIGGEYAAVNSAIDELIPAKYRGRVDLVVNGSFWLGAAGGALAVPFLLDQHLFAPDFGWRLGFGIGAVLGLGILLLRRFVPESPRWLVTHGQNEQAEKTVSEIEKDVEKATGQHPAAPKESIEVHPKKVFGIGLILSSMIGQYRKRSILALVLMVAQVFPLQLRFLHVRSRPFTLLRGPQRAHRALPSSSRGRKFLRTTTSRVAVRHDRPQGHDRWYVRHQRLFAADHGLSFRRRFSHAADANDCLVFDLLLCIRSGGIQPI